MNDNSIKYYHRLREYDHSLKLKAVLLKTILLYILFHSVLSAQVSLEIGSGSTVEVSNSIGIDVSGHWVDLGTFLPGKSEVSFIGPGRQVISVNGDESFYNLKIDKPSGNLVVFNNLSVLNRMELNKGIIHANSSMISLAEGALVRRTSGYVIGALRQNFSPGQYKAFDVGTVNGYSPVEIRANSGKGDISVIVFEGSQPKVIGTSILQRYWTLSGSGVTRADIKFHYLPEDISGIEANYVTGLYSDRWFFPSCEIDPIAHKSSTSGVAPYGDWTLGLRDALSPAQVNLNFTITANSVNLFWHVPAGFQNYSFVLERADFWLKDWKPVADVGKLQQSSSPGGFTYSDKPPSGRFLYRLKQTDKDGDIQYSNEVEVAVELPGSFSLHQNYPNPFNSDTKITYTLPVDAKVNLMVFNITGQKISDLVDEYQPAGQYTVGFDASNLASGTYLYKLIAGGYVQTKKMILLR